MSRLKKNSMIKERRSNRTSVVLHEVAMMFWFKLCRDNNVVDSDLRIEAFKSEERHKNVHEGTLGMDGTLEIDEAHSSVGSDA